MSSLCAKLCTREAKDAALPEWVVPTGNPVLSTIPAAQLAAKNAAAVALRAASDALKCAEKCSSRVICTSAPPCDRQHDERPDGHSGDEWCVIGLDRPHSV